MNFDDYRLRPNEKPLDRIPADGGFCGIFRTIACIGDSLSSGEFESADEEGKPGYHDYYEYSWGQYLARNIGSTVLNFSRGGMSAKWYCDTYANEKGFWDPDRACQAYIIALGVNDISTGIEIGSAKDIDLEDPSKNAETFAGYYGRIIQRYKAIQPQAKFFLMTIPESWYEDDKRREGCEKHSKLLYELAELFDYTYVLDFRKYAPKYDEDFRRDFFLSGHMNPAGYMLTAKMVAAYIDYLIRSAPEDFAQVAFIGRGVHNCKAKW